MADVGGLDAEERAGLDTWLEQGGVLLRFAGPKLARRAATIWSRCGCAPATAPGRRAVLGRAPALPLPARQPFAGLPVTDEVLSAARCWPSPAPTSPAEIMATLADGTPLVTGARRGDGWLILVHTTANTAWTTLPLSGLFVRDARAPGRPRPRRRRRRARAAASRAACSTASAADEPPSAGRRSRPAIRRPCPALHPPGLYAPVGRRRRRSGRRARAQPAARRRRASRRLAAPPSTAAPESYARAAECDLGPWLCPRRCSCSLSTSSSPSRLRGLRPAAGGAAGAAAPLLCLLAAAPAGRRTAGRRRGIVELTRETLLAYVRDRRRRDVDAISAAGLKGLTRVLFDRTAIEPADRWRSTSRPTISLYSRCSTGRSRPTIRTCAGRGRADRAYLR